MNPVKVGLVGSQFISTIHAESLKRVSDSLSYAKDSRRAMESSCCNQSCEYELEDR